MSHLSDALGPWHNLMLTGTGSPSESLGPVPKAPFIAQA